MKNLLPLIPFVAALGLLACQGNDGPVAEEATAPGDAVVGDAATNGLAAPTTTATAEAVDQAALPIADNGMGWTSTAPGSASFGPRGARALLTFACDDQALRVTRLHPATPGATGTLSLTGTETASSLPMQAVAKPGGPGESEWQGEARGDIARAVARAFAGKGVVEVTIGAAPALAVPTSPVADAVFDACAR